MSSRRLNILTQMRRGRFVARVALFICFAFVLTALFPPCKVLNASSFMEICTAQGIQMITVSDSDDPDSAPPPSSDLCSYCVAQSLNGTDDFSESPLQKPEGFPFSPLPVLNDLVVVSENIYPGIQSRAPPVLS